MKWLDRAVLHGAYLCLCLTQKDFDRVNKHLKCSPEEFPTDHGRCYTYERKNKITCVIAIGDANNLFLSEAVGILTHEATHVKQAILEQMNETKPGHEMEAYILQNIIQTLFKEFLRQTKIKDKKVKNANIYS